MNPLPPCAVRLPAASLLVLFTAACGENGTGPGTPADTVAASQLAAGRAHACVLDGTGAPFCWGDNTNGQLGTGTSSPSPTPVRVSGDLRFALITSGGADHTCGLTQSGEAYCWGWNPFGQLGDGTTTNRLTPVRAAADTRFVSLSAGVYHTCGLVAGGRAYCWGADRFENNDGSALGATVEATCVNPQPIYRGATWPCSISPLEVATSIRFRDIRAGMMVTCGLDTGGRAFCWGWNEVWQVGDGTVDDAAAPTAVAGGLRFTSLTIGVTHACGLETGGQAHCWGARFLNHGALGNGQEPGTEGNSTPRPVVGGLTFSALVAASANNIYTFTCGLTGDDQAYCWGANNQGALGTTATMDTCPGSNNVFLCSTSTPLPVEGGLLFLALAAGMQFTCGITTAQAVYCWGANGSGQLGNGSTADSFTPVAVTLPVALS